MKYRQLVTRTIPIVSGLKTHHETLCDGTTSAGSYTFPVVAAIDSDITTESLSSTNGRKRANNCVHRRKRFVVNDGGAYYAYGYGTGPFGVSVYPDAPGLLAQDDRSYLAPFDTWSVPPLNGIHDLPKDWSIASQNINEERLKNDCYEKAAGLQADILLNLLEANQALPAVYALTDCLPEMAKNWKRIRKVVRTASGAWLAWKFGVSPILQDIQNVTKYMPHMVSDLKRHADQKSYRYSAKAELTAQFDAKTTQLWTVNSLPSTVQFSTGRVNYPPTVRYVMVVRPRVKYYTQFASAMAACMSRFATGPATLAWELVPFSFVVDWFIDLRGVLRMADDLLRSPPYEVLSFTRSYKYDVQTDLRIEYRSPCSGNGILSARDAGFISSLHYERILVPKGPTKVTWIPRFGKNQLGISAALIGQKLSAAKRFR